ncbi:unnamed protein product [Rhizoctonia solani]|uniref:Proteophosphoglycan ppg4 n=1 Tax=Rhizoctonia solani TaxID=456999 RepID=A0A8H3GVQ7_9AGAM|nr:unnamed protein product [Rhizoctonia solani]
MSEPIVTSTSSTHSARISKPQTDPHSVAHEQVPPESRPVGSEEHATTGPSDPPPGAKEGEQYPPQLHAGKVGYGPHYAEVHGNDSGLGAKLTGVKEQLKGKITRNHELEQQGKDRKTGELAAKQRAKEEEKNPFHKQDEEADQKPAGDETKVATEKTKTEFKPGANKTNTEGGPTVERIPSSTAASTTESRGTLPGTQDTPSTRPQAAPVEAQHATTETQGTPTFKSQDVLSTKSQDALTTKSQGAPTATEQDSEGTAIRH